MIYSPMERSKKTTFNTLFEIYQRGIDINDAGRAKLYTLPNLTYRDVDGILEYRKEAGSINDPADLVANDVLTQEQLTAIAPFLWKTDRATPKQETKGSFHLQTRLSGKNDRYPPASAFQGRLRALGKLHLGVGGSPTAEPIG